MFDWILFKIFGIVKAKDIPGFFIGCKKPEDIANRVSANIFWKSDKEVYGKQDYWATPLETIKNRKGDCEDMALLVIEGIKQLPNISQELMTTLKVFCVFPKVGIGHAVAVFKNNGRYIIIDCTAREQWFLATSIKTDDALAKFVMSNYDHYYFTDPRYGFRKRGVVK